MDGTNTEDMAVAAEVCRFKPSGTTPELTLVPEFRDVTLQEGLEPYLHHVTIASHRRALARLRLSCNKLRVCTYRIVKPVRPLREERVCRLCSTGAVEDELHILTTCPALAALRTGCPDLQREHNNLANVFANCELRSLGWFAYQALREHGHLLETMGQPLWPASYIPQSNSRAGPCRRRR